MVLPKTNRCVMFDAQYLHGVIPGRGANSSPHTNARRLTFMVGFWKDIAAKDRGKCFENDVFLGEVYRWLFLRFKVLPALKNFYV